MRKNKVIVCPANGMPYVANVSDNLESLQRIVGGRIEAATMLEDALVICNEEGRLLNLPENRSLFLAGFCGDCLICGTDGEDFASLPDPARKILLQSCKARYKKHQEES